MHRARQKGWTPLELEGWHQPPFFDPTTNNLTWTTRLSSDGEPVINHSVRLLGRSGIMRAQLVADVSTFDATTLEFDDLLRSYSFSPGQRYAEFRSGDKLAGYGLTALIAGGAGAAAVKTGVLQKAWKVPHHGCSGRGPLGRLSLGVLRPLACGGLDLPETFAGVHGVSEPDVTFLDERVAFVWTSPWPGHVAHVAAGLALDVEKAADVARRFRRTIVWCRAGAIALFALVLVVFPALVLAERIVPWLHVVAIAFLIAWAWTFGTSGWPTGPSTAGGPPSNPGWCSPCRRSASSAPRLRSHGASSARRIPSPSRGRSAETASSCASRACGTSTTRNWRQ